VLNESEERVQSALRHSLAIIGLAAAGDPRGPMRERFLLAFEFHSPSGFLALLPKRDSCKWWLW
jgi:hypothetical protein